MLKECMSERMSLRLVFVEVGGLNPPPPLLPSWVPACSPSDRTHSARRIAAIDARQARGARVQHCTALSPHFTTRKWCVEARTGSGVALLRETLVSNGTSSHAFRAQSCSEVDGLRWVGGRSTSIGE